MAAAHLLRILVIWSRSGHATAATRSTAGPACDDPTCRWAKPQAQPTGEKRRASQAHRLVSGHDSGNGNGNGKPLNLGWPKKTGSSRTGDGPGFGRRVAARSAVDRAEGWRGGYRATYPPLRSPASSRLNGTSGQPRAP